MADKIELANLLEEIADLQEFLGGNIFKINAYRNAANVLKRTEEDVNELIRQKQLQTLKGIGQGIFDIISEYIEMGQSELLTELKSKVPDDAKDLLKIRGLGFKKIIQLHEKLGINSVDDLDKACKEGSLLSLKGFGLAAQKNIILEIEKYKKNRLSILLSSALRYAHELENIFEKFEDIKFMQTGELRRRCEIISSIEFVIFIKNNEIKDKIIELLNLSAEDELYINHHLYPVPVKIYFIENIDEFYTELFLTTGSKEFLENLKYTPEKIAVTGEEQIFKSAGIKFVIPEMREGEYFLPEYKSIINNSDLNLEGYKGFIHFHTNYTDGINSVEEMCKAAIETDMEYAVICDHSKTAAYARGLKEDRIIEQAKEIKEISKSLNFKLFQGIESDILPNGSLDYSEDILKEFSFVVASVHSNFNLDEKDQTDRIIKAVENQYTNLLGHPTGRLLLSRESYKIDFKKIIDACAANNTAIEVNASPNRLDIDWRYIYYAREKGCMFAINSDAHSVDEIMLIKYGIMISRKAGLTKKEVINYFDFEDFKKSVNLKFQKLK